VFWIPPRKRIKGIPKVNRTKSFARSEKPTLEGTSQDCHRNVRNVRNVRERKTKTLRREIPRFEIPK
jgi:hypothetical protein